MSRHPPLTLNLQSMAKHREVQGENIRIINTYFMYTELL